jgi:hypothetical protein
VCGRARRTESNTLLLENVWTSLLSSDGTAELVARYVVNFILEQVCSWSLH